MMKKWTALLMAALLLLGCAAAFAERNTEQEVMELNWEDVDQQNREGKLMTLTLRGLKILVPAGFEAEKPSVEQIKSGGIVNMVDEANSVMIGVLSYTNVEVEGYKAQLIEELGMEVTDLNVNGMAGIFFEEPEREAAWGVVNLEEGGSIFVFVRPYDREAHKEMMFTVLSSIHREK